MHSLFRICTILLEHVTYFCWREEIKIIVFVNHVISISDLIAFICLIIKQFLVQLGWNKITYFQSSAVLSTIRKKKYFSLKNVIVHFFCFTCCQVRRHSSWNDITTQGWRKTIYMKINVNHWSKIVWKKVIIKYDIFYVTSKRHLIFS